MIGLQYETLVTKNRRLVSGGVYKASQEGILSAIQQPRNIPNKQTNMSIASILTAAGITIISSQYQLPGIINYTSNGTPAVLNIYSEFCGYSKQMATPFANLHSDSQNIHFFGADVNEIEGIGAEYKIQGVPTFIGFACGKEVSRVTGADESGLSQLLTQISSMKCA